MVLNLKGKVAVVTGASKGIGAGIAIALAREGVSVVVNYQSDQAGAKLVVMALQVDAFEIHRCYAKVIPNASSDELGVFLQEKIAPEAAIKTDQWTGYSPSKADFPNLKQEKSDKGKRRPPMHQQIMMFKAWLRGIHHHCDHLQRYIDEFCYRFNRIKYPRICFTT